MKVLIVDDSRAMRLIVKRTLREAGFGGHEIEEAIHGAGALQKIRAAPPHLVLSDWNMPTMGGIELLQALKGDNIAVHFGFVTSEGTEEIRTQAEASGALFLITKPFTPESFQDALQPYLPKA